MLRLASIDLLSQADRFLVFAEIGLGQAGNGEATADCASVARAQAQCFQDMSLGLLRLASENARKANAGPRARVKFGSSANARSNSSMPR